MRLTSLAEIAAAIGASAEGRALGMTISGVSTDTRTLSPGDLYVALSGPRFDGHDFVREAAARGARACIVRSGFDAFAPAPLLRVSDTTVALGRMAAWYRSGMRATVIAVTGSNGKTTTKNMLAHVLGSRHRVRASRKSFNNQIGVPLTLLECAADDAYLVVEIGSNAPGEVAALAEIASPDVGVVTSVGKAHLAGFGSVEGVFAEKMSLFDHVRTGGSAFVHASVVAGLGMLPRAGELRWVTFGEHPDADVRVAKIEGDLECTRATIEDGLHLSLRVPGAHNAVNASGVFAVCRHLGMSAADILAALGTFEMPELRMRVLRFGGVTVIDDCYNANPSSMSAALDVLGRADGSRRVLVAGGMAELGSESIRLHRAVGRQASRVGVGLVVAVGESAREIASAHAKANAVLCDDVGDALDRLPGILKEGDVVLIKGSRSAGLEALAGRIEAAFGAAQSAASAAGS